MILMGNEPVLYAILVILVIVLVAFAFYAGSNYKAWGSTATTTVSASKSVLTITASGTVYNSSAEAYVDVNINGTGATNKQAVQNLSASLDAFNSTISKYINGNFSRITTIYFNVYKIYNETGYQAQESLTVVLPNIKNVSPSIESLSAIPNVYVSDATPELSDAQVSSMRIAALSLALSNATQQAEALIGTNSTILSKNISVNNYYVYPYMYSIKYPLSAGGATGGNVSIPPQFYGGTNRVTESVTVVFVYGKK